MGRQSLTYGEEQINYKVCFVPRRTRKVAIHVHPDGVVQVDAPQGAESVRNQAGGAQTSPMAC